MLFLASFKYTDDGSEEGTLLRKCTEWKGGAISQKRRERFRSIPVI